MTCGYCKGEPKCLDKKVAFACPSCNRLYLKPGADGKKISAEIEVAIQGEEKGFKFRIVDIIGKGKQLTQEQKEWLKGEAKKGIKAPDGTPFDPLDPDWYYEGEEWHYEG